MRRLCHLAHETREPSIRELELRPASHRQRTCERWCRVENIERVCRPSVLKLEDYDPGMTIEEVERDLGLIDITKLSEGGPS